MQGTTGGPAAVDGVLTGQVFLPGAQQPVTRYLFLTHYHPQLIPFASNLYQRGIPGLLGNLNLQSRGDGGDTFVHAYSPIPTHLEHPFPVESVDFTHSGAYSVYNWEIFFHIPLLVAQRFLQQFQYEQALSWLQYIFDPTDSSQDDAPQRFWRVRPFREYDLRDPESAPIQDLMRALSEGDGNLAQQVAEWRADPFNPHAIARLRPVAYQKKVAMTYLDAVIGWADQLFARDTIESINEATQLYLLAAGLLGPRPGDIHRLDPPPRTFNQIEPDLDVFSNALVEIENQLALGFGVALPGTFTTPDLPVTSPPPLGATLFFCIPPNDKLLAYWDTLADRLFKIRNCLNIEGVARVLPLFEPPIDPGLLVQAAAAGIDIGSVLNDLVAPLPHYRFATMAQRAATLCGDVMGLGAALLAAIEKRDAEQLNRLRAGQEVNALRALREVREQQLAEAREAVEVLQRGLEAVAARQLYYSTIPDRIDAEIEHLDKRIAPRRRNSADRTKRRSPLSSQ